MSLARQGRNETAARLDVGLQVLESLDPPSDLRIVGGSHVSTFLRTAAGPRRVEVPVFFALHVHSHEAAVRREFRGKRLIQATLDELSVDRLVGDIEAVVQGHAIILFLQE